MDSGFFCTVFTTLFLSHLQPRHSYSPSLDLAGLPEHGSLGDAAHRTAWLPRAGHQGVRIPGCCGLSSAPRENDEGLVHADFMFSTI